MKQALSIGLHEPDVVRYLKAGEKSNKKHLE